MSASIERVSECFAGIDWGEFEHAVSVVDSDGREVHRFTVKHDAKGLMQLVTELSEFHGDRPLAVAIERPTGLLVDTLMAAGFTVYAIGPNQVKAARPRYCAAGCKDDRRDAFIAGDLLRTDGHRFRPLAPQSDDLKAMRALVHHRLDLIRTRVAKINELSALLGSFWPGPTLLFSSLDADISLAFLKKYPTPASAEGLTEAKMAAFLKKNRYSGKQPAKQLLEKLRSAAISKTGPKEAEAKGSTVVRLVRILTVVLEEISDVEREIAGCFEKHSDAKILLSLPNTGDNSAPQILVELGDQRDRIESFDQLAAEFGVVPVTISSGKFRWVKIRRACNKKARRAITLFAQNSMRDSVWAKTIYENARARGLRHTKAIRVLARAWLRVIWRLWRDRVEYDVAKHVGARLSTVA